MTAIARPVEPTIHAGICECPAALNQRQPEVLVGARCAR